MRKYVIAGLLVVSVILTIMLIAGSYVSYRPTISALEMQNIYLGRISRFGLAIVVIQSVALLMLITERKR